MEWINVNVKLPEVFNPYDEDCDELELYEVLVSRTNGTLKIASLQQWDIDNEDKPCWYLSDRDATKLDDGEVTHWMPLPEPCLQLKD